MTGLAEGLYLWDLGEIIVASHFPGNREGSTDPARGGSGGRIGGILALGAVLVGWRGELDGHGDGYCGGRLRCLRGAWGGRFLRRRLLDFLADHVGQTRESAESGDAVFQIVPEANAQLATGFLQAGEGVSATPTRSAPRATADLATLDELADVRFLRVVVQWNFRMLQHA